MKFSFTQKDEKSVRMPRNEAQNDLYRQTEKSHDLRQ